MDFAEINDRLQENSRRLNEQRSVRPGSLRSKMPFFGPLITWGRRLWNNVAGRWYVDPIVIAQNAFNEAVARSFDDMGEIIVNAAGQVEALQAEVTELQKTLRAMGRQQREAPTQDSAPMAPQSTTRSGVSRDEEEYWDDWALESLLRAKEEILTRRPGEEEAAYLRRFEADGAEHASWLGPYYQAESTVLEIGCGIGRILKYVQAKERWGLDISQGMLDWAEVYLDGQEGIHLVKTNGFDFQGVPSDHFDLVYSLLVLQHINKRAGFNYLRETLRVLKPGGCYHFQLMNLLCEEGFRQFLSLLETDYRYAPLYFYTPEELRYKLSLIGLQIKELHTSGDSIYVTGYKPLE